MNSQHNGKSYGFANTDYPKQMTVAETAYTLRYKPFQILINI